KEELPDEDIEVIEEEKEELPDEDIEVIEEEKEELPDEEIEVIEEEKEELPNEDIEVIEEEKTEIPEEIKVKEQKINKPKKQNRLIAFVRNIFNKKDNKRTINKIDNKKSNNKKLTKMNIVESYVKNNYKNNNEIKDFINLIKIREDKETIISELYEYILGTKDKISEEEFLNELHNIFGISKKEEKTFKQEKTKSSNPIKEKISEAEKQKRQRISEVNRKYLNIKNELFNELDEYEKAFVEDMHSEGLKPGDAELDQMFNERPVNKAKIYKYLLEIEKNKILYTYEKSNASLDEYEKVFIEDMYSNNIKITDPEFNQMIFERCVDKDSIINYFKELNNINNIDLVKSNENIKLIIEDYKKHINFESSIDLKEKKVNELKQIAKERKLEKFSKMNKQQLIDALNQLTELKKLEADRQLGLVK
ncbi:MAG: Rho termination factor N-terminal domain-containing protein, partial [Bacilli bacterium]|nr:Rho termination factor N-terminal domain-containing protein [Bacilli bacterium]